jgi:microcompartment protein CcmK/EutM
MNRINIEIIVQINELMELKKLTILFLLITMNITSKAQKSVAVDSTGSIIKEWIAIISNESYISDVCARGIITRAEYESNLKLINLSLENYLKGKYTYAFEDINDVKKVEKFMEVSRIKYFLLTMTEIKLYKYFKARKWYYVSKTKTSVTSFARLQKNVENMKLHYKIDNYRKVRKSRITALFVGAGALIIIPEIIGILSE